MNSETETVPEGDVGKIIVRPAELRGKAGWEAWESEQVRPFYRVRRQAIDYAITRGDGRRPLEVRDADGRVLKAIDAEGLKGLAYRLSLGNEESEPST